MNRPKLTAESVAEYLDWCMENHQELSQPVRLSGAFQAGRMPVIVPIEHHLRAVELVIRTRATDAQGKATQHTLVEQGIIEAPPLGEAAQVAEQ